MGDRGERAEDERKSNTFEHAVKRLEAIQSIASRLRDGPVAGPRADR